MLKRTKVKQLLASEQTSAEVLVKGWVKTKRDSKDFSFIEINDGSCLKNIQVIANNTLNNYDEIKKPVLTRCDGRQSRADLQHRRFKPALPYRE